MIYVRGNKLNIERFPDGTPKLELPRVNKCDHVDIEWKYEDDSELFIIICIKKHYDRFQAHVRLFMEYLPNARYDRVNEVTEVFTLKYFCEIINSLNFNSVFTRDVHSNVSTALLDNVVNISPMNKIAEVEKRILFDEDELVVFFPDEGAMKRYSKMVDRPYAFGVKDRDWKTGEIKGLQIINKEVVKDMPVLIIDDICSKGGTFYHSAKALKEAGAKNIYLYITHCEDTIHEGELLKDNGLIEHIYTTDSIYTKEHEKITIV